MEKGLYSTRDVSLAAFFRYKGYKIVKYVIIRDGKEGEWQFNMTKEKAEELTMEYVNSPIAEFEGIRRGLAKQKYR